MPASTHATRAEVLTDLVRRARRAGITVTFDHDGVVVLNNPKDAEAQTPEAQPASEGDAAAKPE